MQLTLIRHAPPLQQGICYGHYNIPVRDWTAQEKQLLLDAWQYEHAHTELWCSTSHRCVHIAQQLNASNPAMSFLCNESLRELYFGNWEGMLWSQIPRHHSELWTANWQTQAPPGGEAWSQLVERMHHFLAELKNRNRDAWVIGHAGPFRVLQALIRNEDPALWVSTPVPHLERISLEVPHA